MQHMNPETKLQRRIMLAISDAGYTVWRNETGQFWTGQVIHRDATTVTLANARMVPCGLCPGSHDLIGIADGGVFASLEVKTSTGRLSPQQQTFGDHVTRLGGIAGVARSPDEALAILKGEKKWRKS